MNLQDLADALQDCAGACSVCRKSGDNGGHCCGSRFEATELKLTCMIPITKEMIMLGREWIGKYIRQALNEACCSAAEEVRKTLCLPSEERVGVKMRPVVRGHWISETEADMLGDILLTGACSVCRQCNWDNVESYGFNFCPNCGAKMKKGKRYDRS